MPLAWRSQGRTPYPRPSLSWSISPYFTHIFSRIVGPAGRVYAFLPSQQLANCSASETAGTRAFERDSRYTNVKVVIDAADRFAVPEPVDMVWLSQGYHDLQTPS